MSYEDTLSNQGFPAGSDGKESACNAGDLGWEDLLKEGVGPFSSILVWKLPTDRGTWWATAHGGHKESDMTEQLSTAPYLIRYKVLYWASHMDQHFRNTQV